MERFLFKTVEIWAVLLVLVLGFVGLIWMLATLKSELEADGPAAGVGQFVVDLASVPEHIGTLVETGLEFDDGGLVQRNPQILPGDFQSNLIVHDETFEDDGILLVSAYSDEAKMNVVYLYDLATRDVLWEWTPRPEEIVASSERLSRQQAEGVLDPIETPALFRSQSPLLLEDGSMIVTSGEGTLSKWSACGVLEWVNDRHFHHSIMPYEDGSIVPVVIEDSLSFQNLKEGLRDDGYAILDSEGEIVSETSILDILYANDRFHTVLGRDVGNDPVHLNDAEVIKESDGHVEAGDIMLSSRHLSAVFLYRPSTGDIVWYRAGPWLAQHDLDYLGDGRFSLYGNDNSLPLGAAEFPYGHSTIYIFDMETGTVETPYDAVFAALDVKDSSSSTHRVLRNGDAFFERSTTGHMWRISTTGPRWQYVHRTADGIGAMQWSRYYYRDELDLSWMEGMECPD